MLSQLLPSDLFALVLVFARIGSAIMLLPGFGEVYVSGRARLIIALALSLVITPIVVGLLPALPKTMGELLLLVGSEVLIGLFIGAIARFLVSSLHIAGVVMSFQTSLASAMAFDPSTAQQGSMIGTFLSVVGVFMIFIANLHHLMLAGLADSYTLFIPGSPLPVGDFAEMASRLIANSFALALKIAAPIMIIGLIFYLGLGLLARLMPQVQIFFVAIPLQIALGFFILALTLTAAMSLFLDNFEAHWLTLLGRS